MGWISGTSSQKFVACIVRTCQYDCVQSNREQKGTSRFCAPYKTGDWNLQAYLCPISLNFISMEREVFASDVIREKEIFIVLLKRVNPALKRNKPN